MGWEEEYRKALESQDEKKISKARKDLMRRDQRATRSVGSLLIIIIAVLAFAGYAYYKTHH